MKIKPIRAVTLSAVVGALVFCGCRVASTSAETSPATPASPPQVRYVAVGDSYTIGEGAKPEQSWPSLLTAHLNTAGVPTTLVANPSVTGWTTQQAIDRELPIFEASKPTFGSLLIGVNDWVQGVDEATFRARLVTLMDRMLEALPEKSHLVGGNHPGLFGDAKRRDVWQRPQRGEGDRRFQRHHHRRSPQEEFESRGHLPDQPGHGAR